MLQLKHCLEILSNLRCRRIASFQFHSQGRNAAVLSQRSLIQIQATVLTAADLLIAMDCKCNSNCRKL